MDLTVTGNLLEAALWLVIAVLVAYRALRSSGSRRRLYSILSAAYLVFSISDVIESQTGAWWRPFWLLLLKGACICVFLSVAIEFWRIRQTIDSQRSDRNPDD